MPRGNQCPCGSEIGNFLPVHRQHLGSSSVQYGCAGILSVVDCGIINVVTVSNVHISPVWGDARVTTTQRKGTGSVRVEGTTGGDDSIVVNLS